MTVSGTSIV